MYCKAFRKGFPYLIEWDHTGYIKGRYIGKNICAIRDIVEQHENKESIILFNTLKRPSNR